MPGAAGAVASEDDGEAFSSERLSPSEFDLVVDAHGRELALPFAALLLEAAARFFHDLRYLHPSSVFSAITSPFSMS